MSIDEALRQAARRQGLTAYGLAKLSGVNLSAVQRWYSGAGGLRIVTGERLAAALGCRIVLQPVERGRKGG